MAQRNAKHRRSLPTPEAPSLKIYQTNPTAAARSALRSANKIHSPSGVPPTTVDVHFQAKGGTLSADFESVKPSKKLVQLPEKPSKAAAVDIEKFDSLALSDKEMRKQGSVEPEMAVRRSSVSSLMAAGMGRRSFSGMKVELGDVFANNGVKMVSVDMPPFMQIHAVDVTRKARDSLEKFSSKSLAFTLKKEFDGAYGPAWHCIVGTSFGSFVTHSVGGFMYFSMDHKMYVLLFKTTVQRAD